VIPEGNDPHFSKMADIAMMIWPNGLERTAAEFKTLLSAAGFDLVGITSTQSPVSVIDARPS
jgi:C-methyltransferase